MPNSPLFIRSGTQIIGLETVLDGVPNRVHKRNSITGGEPLEDAREVTDHVQASPAILSLDVIVTSFNGVARPREAFNALEELQLASTPVQVVTEWKMYPECVIKRCEARTHGRSMRADLELEEILRVSSSGTPSGVPGDALAGPIAGRAPVVDRGRVAL